MLFWVLLVSLIEYNYAWKLQRKNQEHVICILVLGGTVYLGVIPIKKGSFLFLCSANVFSYETQLGLPLREILVEVAVHSVKNIA